MLKMQLENFHTNPMVQRLPSPHSKATPRNAAADRNITELMLSGKVHYPISLPCFEGELRDICEPTCQLQ